MTATPLVAGSSPTTASVPMAKRVVRCVIGLVACGVGVTMLVLGDVGLAPWDVLHQGITERTGIGIGTVSILVGFGLLLVWIPLQVRLGAGTVLNAIIIGGTVDVLLPHLPEPDHPVVRVALMGLGVLAFGVGTGLYIGARLGPGPRDGLMTGIAARGHSLRLVRTAIEVAVLALGALLGGSIGIGTAVFALAIGPLAQFFLARFDTRPGPHTPAASDQRVPA